jgi:general secretion pathway protein M
MNPHAIRLPADPRARRALAAGILVFLAVVVIAAIAVPVVLMHRHYDAAIDRMTRQWQSQSAFSARRQQMAAALEVLKAREPKKLFLKGATAALAAAELQDVVKLAAESNGGRVISVQGLANKEDAGYRTAAATFQLNVNNTNLRRVLFALESQHPYVFIDNLTVRSHTPPGYRPPPGTPEPDLFVQFDASGLAGVAGEAAATPVASAAGADPAAKGGKP